LNNPNTTVFDAQRNSVIHKIEIKFVKFFQLIQPDEYKSSIKVFETFLWYHGKMSGEEAEEKINKHGNFLVRFSTNSKKYVLSYYKNFYPYGASENQKWKAKKNERRHLYLCEESEDQIVKVKQREIANLIDKNQYKKLNLKSPIKRN
jgi:hypothetical protein